MTNDEKTDGMEAILEDLIEWELSNMSLADLQTYFRNEQRDFYLNYPPAFKDMVEGEEYLTRLNKFQNA
jgi:hypothetical protein